MVQALDQAVKDFNKDNQADIILDIKDIGTFNNKVVFAKVQENKSLSRVVRLTDIIETNCQTYGVPHCDGNLFNPHITIAKLSRLPFELKGIANIEPTTYNHYMNYQFGRQLVTCLQLCAMRKPMDEEGYYHVSHRTQINQCSNPSHSAEKETILYSQK
ncbi:A-kinase anchor protein 7 [Mytilus galloprovincialis]|uniref:A-kinase anchor protein 7 n=1 Tax=Mytilus galloprovincialis TaxID=29158 RepID=A0A8B6EBD1_MYTGA|nr:A-kinase anchor protein 7 [Mytilus galloprovincialis]